MASTIVCQNLISCFDSQLTTTAEIALTLKLTTLGHDSVRTNLEFGNCWGFTSSIQTLPKDDTTCYSHAWVTKPHLTANSLALCTENLGSESGSDIITDGTTEISTTTSFDFRDQHDPPRRETKSSRKATSFPPPLTTMIASNSLRMRRRREGGRLIIEAVEAPFAKAYLQAERSDGRLRLRCFSLPAPETTSVTDGDDEEEEEECVGETAEEEEIDDCGVEIESEQEELKMEGEVNNVEKFQQRLSRRRCKEGSHGSKELMGNWKPAALWVSTA